MQNKSKHILSLLAVLLLLTIQPVFAAGPPAPSLFSNTLAVVLIVLMILLLIIIGILGNILVGAASIKVKKRKEEKKGSVTAIILILCLLIAPSLMAQDATSTTVAATTNTIGGMDASAFYVMAVIIFLELLVILVLLINVKLLLRKEKEKAAEAEKEISKEAKANRLNWWDRFNKLRPVSQEAELDLGHEYDGIRELNNRLPPWWLYGFYVTIIFAVIYLWRFHVSHTGPSSQQEYERSVAQAEVRIQEYIKKKGESVDENTVTLLNSAEDIKAGKTIFLDPSKCATCHGTDGGGTVGPNLTDNYWLYGGGIKDIFKTIKYGTNKGMRSWKDDLSPKQIAQVASYVRSLMGTKPANPKEPQGELYKEEMAPSNPVPDSTKNTISKI